MSLMVEWFFAEAGNYFPPDQALWLRLINPEFQASARAFAASMERMHGLWEMAPRVAELFSKYLLERMRIMLGSDRLKEFASEERLQDFMNATQTEFRARVDQKTKDQGDKGSGLKAIGFDRKDAILRFNRFVNEYDWLHGPVQALLQSQLILTWGAFEKLAEDLWAALAKCLPSLAREKARFSRLDDIRKTYSHLNSPEIDALLTDPILRMLNLMRNLIVHKSAKVDQKFLDSAEEILWTHNRTIGQDIVLEGNNVRNLITPTVRIAEKLIRTVDVLVTLGKRKAP